MDREYLYVSWWVEVKERDRVAVLATLYVGLLAVALQFIYEMVRNAALQSVSLEKVVAFISGSLLSALVQYLLGMTDRGGSENA